MNTTCPACGRQIGTYDLCSHRKPEYRYRLCLACCLDEHRPAKVEEVPEWAR